MYYSEFTLKLIEEVKKREILYNTKYEKRPKSEKETAWKGIGQKLDTDSEKCKKHWKNVRDRFVKVMHQRDKHFVNGGSELNAPQYIYFDKLNFMREFSIQKEPNVEHSNSIIAASTNLSPDHLIFEEYKDASGETAFFDYTDQFLERIKEFPVLYDQHAEMRKYRSKEAWKQLADSLGGKFTVGKLRLYWMTLIKKYKMYLENTHSHCEPIENETLYESLSFANAGILVKQEASNDIQFILQSDDMDSSRELFEELNDEEHLMCEEVEDTSVGEEMRPQAAVQDDETVQAVESIEEIGEPETKKLKLDMEMPKIQSFTLPDFRPSFQPTQVVEPPNSHPVPPTTAEDEFDYFGKKVALQLRNLAQKSRSVARKGEIKVLQLLMELEESLES